MQKKQILCVGLTPAWQEIMAFERLRPGQVNRAVSRSGCAAGKGTNVARAVRRLGEAPVLLAFAGGHPGRQMADDLRRAGITARLVSDPAPTRLCVTLLERGAGTVTELVGEAALPPPGAWRVFFAAYRRLLDSAQVVVIAGAPMPGASEGVYARLVAAAAQAGVPVLLDTRNRPLLETLPHHPQVVKLNREELAVTLGRRTLSLRAVVQGARRLIRAGAGQVIVTAGCCGAWLVTPRAVWHVQPPAVRTVNSVGCGDAMTGGLACALARGYPPARAIRLGVACGTASALTEQPADLEPAAVRRLLRQLRVTRVPEA
jgi:1-phosphofructokinase family hexose kinase